MNAGLLAHLAIGGLAFAHPAAAAETRPLIQVTVELIEVPSAEATRLLAKEKLGTDGVKLRAELETLITQGKASVFDTMLMTTISGQKVEAEAIREVIYPTEYEPPGLPGSFGPGGPATPSREELAARRKDRIYPPNPTAFDTRNTGNTFSIEPILTSNHTILEQRVDCQIVMDAGMKKMWSHKDFSDQELKISFPYFYTLNIKTPILSGDGVPALLSVLTPTSKKGPPDPTRKLLVLITADVITATPSAK